MVHYSIKGTDDPTTKGYTELGSQQSNEEDKTVVVNNEPPGHNIYTTKQKLVAFFTLMALIFGVLSLLLFIIAEAATSSSVFAFYPNGTTASASAPASNHTLHTNEDARKSSKKLYELLSDFDSSVFYYDDENMILGSKLLSPNTYSRQPYVANGYIGSRIPNLGFGYALDSLNIWTNSGNDEVPGALNNGWPLRNRRFAGSFVSDFYCLEPKLNSTNFPELDKQGYTTVLSSIPEWTNIQFSVKLGNGEVYWFNPEEVSLLDITNYNQNLSMADGLVTTDLDWLNGTIHVTSQVWAHRRIYPLGLVNLNISLNSPDAGTVEVDLYDILDFNTSHRTVLQDFGSSSDGIYMIVEPENVPYSNAALYSTWSIAADTIFEHGDNFNYTLDRDLGKVTQSKKVALSPNSPNITVEKYVAIMSSEFDTTEYSKLYGSNITTLEIAKKIALNSKNHYSVLLNSHRKIWEELYGDAFIEIPSDSLLELTARSSLFHLLANTRTFNVSQDRGLPVPVSGLSSDSYGGMVFWDADIWMQPAILPFFPQIAKNMNNYRNSTHQQAILNAEQNNYPGAVYPWTSGRFANCTSTGPCIDYEYHINVDIAMASFSIYLNGQDVDDDYLRYTTWPIVRDAAVFFSAYVEYNQTLGQYETHNLTDPDEFANAIDNGAFTNAGIKTLLKWATDIGNHLQEYVDPVWMEISHNIYIPKSPSNITLEYSGMNSSVEIKQADVTLMVYPLGYINDESILNNAIKDLYYYSERQSASGPAMTYPVFVAAAAGLLNHGSSSQSYLYKSVLPYLRAPFAQFSEQSDDNFLTNGLTQPAFPFLTANGGFLQSILFGLTGIRYSYEVNSATKKMVRVLRFNPVKLQLLPGGIAIRNFKYMGQVLDIVIDDHNGTIVHKSGNQPIKIKVPDRDLIHDRDILPYQGNDTKKVHKRGIGSENDIHAYGVFYTLNPNEELSIPLFTPELNIAGNIAESKQITNLTAGVSGDVAFSALDGNNYTHWQPADKNSVAKLLIDLGEHNQQEIKNGMILWGSRPAKNISIAILPHVEKVERIFAKVTEFMENYDIPQGDVEIADLLKDIGDSDVDVEGVCGPKTASGCAEDLKMILNWKLDNIDDFLRQLPDLEILKQDFVTLIDNYAIEPSEPYYYEVYNQSLIEILPSNKTEFTIDYDSIESHLDKSQFNGTAWRKARFIIVSVEGSYDDDDDEKGGTIKEIVFRNS